MNPFVLAVMALQLGASTFYLLKGRAPEAIMWFSLAVANGCILAISMRHPV